MLFSLAVNSLRSRKTSVLLTLFSLMISIAVLVGVEHIRHQAKESFNRTVSGVDLIIGARTGQLNLLLYSVFRMGSPTNNIDWNSYTLIQKNPLVKWTVPVSLGDSHRGYRVMGTTNAYFEHYRYGDKRNLAFSDGTQFGGIFSAVLGAEVAATLGYKVGDPIVVAHGIGSTSFTKHDKAPFVVAGILAPTGTPVDKTVHVTLEGIEAVHLAPAKLQQVLSDPDGEKTRDMLKPTTITATFVGLKSKFATFKLQRDVNQYRKEPLMAILPGVALVELWQMMGTVENILRIVAFLVLVSSLLGLATMLLASMRERKGEIAILRAIGAGPGVIFMLIVIEALVIAIVSLVCAYLLDTILLISIEDWLVGKYGLFISTQIVSENTLIVAGKMLLATLIVACIPAIGAYRGALQTSLSGR